MIAIKLSSVSVHFCRHEQQLKVFFVGGPNQRKDFHLEEGEELFYMKKGAMELIIQEKGKFKTVTIQEGEVRIYKLFLVKNTHFLFIQIFCIFTKDIPIAGKNSSFTSKERRYHWIGH